VEWRVWGTDCGFKHCVGHQCGKDERVPALCALFLLSCPLVLPHEPKHFSFGNISHAFVQ
jgi:hypothetical protein